MKIIKSLHSSLTTNQYQYNHEKFYSVSVMWPFNLITGEPILEQQFWQLVAPHIQHGVFDEGHKKPQGEFLVHGMAYSPNAHPVPELTVSARVGSHVKTLLLTGERHWRGDAWSHPQPFTQLSLELANAYGGIDFSPNPSGKGRRHTASPEVDIEHQAEPIMAPNIEYPNHRCNEPNHDVPIATLSVLSHSDPQRVRHQGTFDQHYAKTYAPGFPIDFNSQYFMQTASDQHLPGYINTMDDYELHHLHADMPALRGMLPAIQPRCFYQLAEQPTSVIHELALDFDTLHLFPNECLGVMVSRGKINANSVMSSPFQTLLLAHESVQQPRPTCHYEQQLRLRSDDETAWRYSLDTSPLIPEGVTCGFKLLMAQGSVEHAIGNAQRTFSERQIEQAKLQAVEQIEASIKDLEQQGLHEQADALQQQLNQLKKAPETPKPDAKLQAIDAAIAKALPPSVIAEDGGIDLTAIDFAALDKVKQAQLALSKDQQQQIRQVLQQQMEHINNETLDQDRKKQLIDALQQQLDALDLPPLPPRFDQQQQQQAQQQIIEQIKQQIGQIQQADWPEADKQQALSTIDTDKINEQLAVMTESMSTAKLSYLQAAHFIPTMRSPHAGEEPQKALAFTQHILAGKRDMQVDMAFCELNSVNMTNRNLNDSYFEFARLQQWKCHVCSFSLSNFAHATLTDCEFTQCDFTQANLGALTAHQVRFRDCDLNQSTVAKSRFTACRFERVVFGDRLDNWLESGFQQCTFVGCRFEQYNFIELSFDDCEFVDCEFIECHFVECKLPQLVLNRCTIKSANFISPLMNHSRITDTTMTNARFLNGADFSGSTFTGLKAESCNFRDTRLDDCQFTHATLTESDFSNSHCTRTQFNFIRARTAQFKAATLTQVGFKRADLMSASFIEAKIQGCNFSGASLYEVSFMGATMADNCFDNADTTKTFFPEAKS